MKIFKILFISFFLFGLTFSCGKNKMQVPPNLLQPEEFVQLMIEMHLVDGYLHQSINTINSRKDSALIIYPAILKKYNIPRYQLDSTILFYGKHPDELSKLYDKVLVELSRMEGETRVLLEKDSIQSEEE